MYVLDTDVCSYAMKRSHADLESRIRRFEPGELKVSVATVYELHTGAEKAQNRSRILHAIEAFLALVEVLDFDPRAAHRAAAVRAELERAGGPIGAIDMLIAGHTLAVGGVLVTNNTREFRRVEGLRLENWAEAPDR